MPLSAKQLVLFVVLNVICWLVISFSQCNTFTNSNSTSVEDWEAGDVADLVSDEPVITKPNGVGKNKKLLRISEHIQCPFEVNNEKKFRVFDPDINRHRISLRKDRFILNINDGDTFTPAQQIRAFRETLLFGIYTNRTVVIPPLFKDSNDPSNENIHHKLFQETQDVIDIQKLMKYVPVITLDELAEHCVTFDTVLQNTYLKSGIQEMEVIMYTLS